MRSILYQLKKYQAEVPGTIIEVVDNSPRPQFDEVELAKSVGCRRELLAGMPWPRWVGVLYPAEMVAMHYVVQQGVLADFCGVPFESKCDQALMGFLRRYSQAEYAGMFKGAIDLQVQRLVVIRALVASFGGLPDRVTVSYADGRSDSVGRSSRYDRLPASVRPALCKFLGVPLSISAVRASDLLQAEWPYCSIEQDILGRICYLMLWGPMSSWRLAVPSELLLLSG